MDKKRLELIVGAFVLIGIGLFTFFVFFISGIYLFKSGTTYNVEFSFIAGVGKGATVRYAGVPVGEVSSLETKYDQDGKPSVMIKIWVQEGIEVREHSAIEIRGAFALSEAHIEITCHGHSDGEILKDGAYVKGVDPIPLDNLIRDAEEIARYLKSTAATMDKFVNDPEIQKAFREVILNFGDLTGKLANIMETSEDDIVSIINKTEESLIELKKTIDSANGITGAIEGKEGTIGLLLYDDQMYTEIMEFIRDIKANPWKLLKKTKEKKV
jgi:phospholipid/cholesterol/gamma-HCH transport system substrate-binding protein